MIGFSDCSLMSLGIRLCSGGLFGRGLSHVGIVVEHPDYRTPLIFEATSRCALPCLFAGKHVSGVQAHPLYERIAHFRGTVWHYPSVVRLTLPQIDNLGRYCINSLGLPYDWWGAWLSRRTLLRWLSHHWLRSTSRRYLFCSEFVVLAGLWCLPLDLAPTPLARLAIQRGILQPPERVTAKALGA